MDDLLLGSNWANIYFYLIVFTVNVIAMMETKCSGLRENGTFMQLSIVDTCNSGIFPLRSREKFTESLNPHTINSSKSPILIKVPSLRIKLGSGVASDLWCLKR